MSRIYLEIGNKTELISFLREAKERTGLLKDISLKKVNDTLKESDFPIRIPVNLDGVLDLCGNPILKKMFGKKVEDTTRKYLKKVMEAG